MQNKPRKELLSNGLAIWHYPSERAAVDALTRSGRLVARPVLGASIIDESQTAVAVDHLYGASVTCRPGTYILDDESLKMFSQRNPGVIYYLVDE